MAALTNKSRLDPGPPPDVPPWRWLDSRTMEHWLRISGQTATNWRFRGTGPAWRMDRARRCWYRAADVAAWLDGGDAMERIRAFLCEHAEMIKRGVMHGADRLPGQQLHDALRMVHRDTEGLTDDEVDRLVELIDQVEVFGRVNRKPKGFIRKDMFIGYPWYQ